MCRVKKFEGRAPAGLHTKSPVRANAHREVEERMARRDALQQGMLTCNKTGHLNVNGSVHLVGEDGSY